MTIDPALQRAAAKLPSPPDIVMQLLHSLSQEEIDRNGLVSPLKKDQAMSARVLRLANSGIYAATRPIVSIDDAVSLIGADALRNVVVAAGMSGAFQAVRGVNLDQFWQRNAHTASVASRIAKRVRVDTGLAYTCGLLHRLGHLVMLAAESPHHAQLIAQTQNAPLADLLACEQQWFGSTHVALGEMLARQWRFPASLADTIAHYAQPLSHLAPVHAVVVALASQLTTLAFVANDNTASANADDITESLRERLSIPEPVWQEERTQALSIDANSAVFG